jgi:hypothetical protein
MHSYAPLIDKRIGAVNVLLLMTINEYVNLAQDILNKNVFQRDRVKKSNTVYSLLKTDLLIGCIIPPIILALDSIGEDETELTSRIENCEINYEDLVKNKDHLLILDGFQRTSIILDIVSELERNRETTKLSEFYTREIRIELYTGINRLGILYRMLTLNTGQTPMSLRHQVEMMYTDYLDCDFNGIRLVKDTDPDWEISLNKYRFSDAMDGFSSYLDRNELPIDRLDILDNIKSLEKLAKETKESSKSDIFKEFIQTYNSLVNHMSSISRKNNEGDWKFIPDNSAFIKGSPFGSDIAKIFNKSQALTGFGAAIGKLIDLGSIAGFSTIRQNVDLISEISDDSLLTMLENLERIRTKSKKIGNAQRMYFQYIFRELFNSTGDSFLNFSKAVENAYQKYQSQVE